MATLLYVDDSSLRLEALRTRLEHLGYEVLTANNGAEALEIFTTRSVDLAVVDYYMHGLGGDLVALEMKRLRPDVPIIIFSGAFTLPEMVIAFVDGFVFTGHGPERLFEKVAELLPPHRRIGKSKTNRESAKGAA